MSSNIAQPAPLAEVAGKVAYVTGASRGLGLGIARACHEAGMKVVLGDIDAQQLAKARSELGGGADVHTVRHDVTDRDAWTRVADEIEARFGKLHLLVNNAGVGIQTAASSASQRDWEWALGVNLWGAINGVHTFVPRMRAHGEGAHIVCTSSMSGMLPRPGAGVYVVTKFALVGMIEALRFELQDANIGTSVFCPGAVDTDIFQSERYRPAELANEANPAVKHAPMGGVGEAPPKLMDIGLAGRIVLDGVRHNDLYIFSHAGIPRGHEGPLRRDPRLVSRAQGVARAAAGGHAALACLSA